MQLSQLLSQKGEISGFERKRLKIDQRKIVDFCPICFAHTLLQGYAQQ